MQTDVSSKTVTATGALEVGRTRIKGIYFVAAASAGSIVVKSGGSGGATKLTLATPASATATQSILLPGQGVLCEGDPHLTISNVTSVTVFYG